MSNPSFQSETIAEEGTALRALAPTPVAERVETIVIGGGQAGLSVGYHLQRRGVRFAILDAEERVGNVWRRRWDSLRLFTPAWLDSLDGMPFPAPPHYFPTKDEMADYLESYARHFELPVRKRTRVVSLSKGPFGYRVETDRGVFEASTVVIAMSSYQRPKIPAWARELRSDIVQIHTSNYENPDALRPGAVLMVGAGNSGAEIGVELGHAGHPVVLAGRDTGSVPFRVGGFWGRLVLARIVLRLVFHRLLTIRTPFGRKARKKMLHQGGPLIRQKPDDLRAAGIVRAPRVVGVENGQPKLADGSVVEVANVLWATGFENGLDFVKLPIFDQHGDPRHDGGAVSGQPGLFFVGQHFLYALSSTMIHGVGRDAERIAGAVMERAGERSLERENGASREVAPPPAMQRPARP